MRVRRFCTEAMAAVYAATLVENVIVQKTSPVLGLATGATPKTLYRQLIDFHRQGLSFAQVTTINLDEYVGLTKDNPNSYSAFMHRELYDQIDIDLDHAHMPDGTAVDLEQECARYDAILEAHPIDLQILGIGRNGHIGFNEPDASLRRRTHVVTLSDETRVANSRFFEDKNGVPRQAITMGLESILRAKFIILLAFGREKADAVRAALAGDISTKVPASFLQMHPNVTFVLDDAAASLIGRNATV